MPLPPHLAVRSSSSDKNTNTIYTRVHICVGEFINYEKLKQFIFNHNGIS